ncbi:protein FAR1-RELATED SEQUENCE 5-like [Miscanthus floridulus]|uniref:protein FAR1-RELATED SEQUENCE 5-like n=1 Tax=Miscanthus floridulus TaxID=154761 RepID=UPI003459C371
MVLKSEIEQVFINTKHRNCLFHIKTKCYNKNVKVFAANEGLYEDFEDIVNNSLTVEEFERLWKRMIEERNLQGNHYFSKMWEMRKMFIPVYYKIDFFPFIQTTSRSEATNARFKDKRYTVNTDLTEGKEEFTCICAKFSKDGILCSHILKIVIKMEINTIPDKYFLDRWSKKDMKVHLERREEETVTKSSLLRFNILSRKSTILNSKAAKNEEAMEYLMAEFDKMEINLDRMLSTQQTGEAQNDQQGETIVAQARDPQTKIDDPERI